MQKIAIVTDTNSGIKSSDESKHLYVVPMPLTIDGEEYFEGQNIEHKEFFEKQIDGANIKSAQPAVGIVEDIWKNLLEKYDSLIYIPMSSALSSSCESAIASSKNFDGKVLVVDNKRISCSLKVSVENALKLAKEEKNLEEIASYLEKESSESIIYISIPTLTYLKKGGRLTPAAALLGTMLSIKPVLQIQQGKLDSFAKCFTFNACKIKMINALKKDIETKFEGKNIKVFLAHTNIPDEAEIFKAQLENALNKKVEILDELPLSISCHIGPGAIACGCAVTLD